LKNARLCKPAAESQTQQSVRTFFATMNTQQSAGAANGIFIEVTTHCLLCIADLMATDKDNAPISLMN